MTQASEGPAPIQLEHFAPITHYYVLKELFPGQLWVETFGQFARTPAQLQALREGQEEKRLQRLWKDSGYGE